MSAPCPPPVNAPTGGWAKCRNFRAGCDWSITYTSLAEQDAAMFERVMHEAECNPMARRSR